MSLIGYERETIINYNDLEQTASVYTCNTALKKKLSKLYEEYPEQTQKIRENEDSVEYIIPKKWVKISPPRKVSDETKEAAKKRLQEYWDNKKASDIENLTV